MPPSPKAKHRALLLRADLDAQARTHGYADLEQHLHATTALTSATLGR